MTRTVIMFNNGKTGDSVVAHPAMSLRNPNIYRVENVPAEIDDATVARRASKTVNATYGDSERRTLDFSELSDGATIKIVHAKPKDITTRSEAP